MPPGIYPRRTVAERFARKWIAEPMSGCWLWEGGMDPRGYGFMSVDYRTTRAHRLSWELHKGPIPAGLFVCHRCDNPGCVNPDHLFLATHDENMSDMVTKGRSFRQTRLPPKTARARGETHPFAKLTEEKVRAIRVDARPMTEIARDYGVSPSTIAAILQRRKWAHLKDPPKDIAA